MTFSSLFLFSFFHAYIVYVCVAQLSSCQLWGKRQVHLLPTAGGLETARLPSCRQSARRVRRPTSSLGRLARGQVMGCSRRASHNAKGKQGKCLHVHFVAHHGRYCAAQARRRQSSNADEGDAGWACSEARRPRLPSQRLSRPLSRRPRGRRHPCRRRRLQRVQRLASRTRPLQHRQRRATTAIPRASGIQVQNWRRHPPPRRVPARPGARPASLVARRRGARPACRAASSRPGFLACATRRRASSRVPLT